MSGGRVIAVGRNSQKLSPYLRDLFDRATERDRKRTGGHAELGALGQANGNARGAVMYVARVIADGTTANAMPCEICQKELAKHGIRRVHYTLGDGLSGVLTL